MTYFKGSLFLGGNAYGFESIQSLWKRMWTWGSSVGAKTNLVFIAKTQQIPLGNRVYKECLETDCSTKVGF